MSTDWKKGHTKNVKFTTPAITDITSLRISVTSSNGTTVASGMATHSGEGLYGVNLHIDSATGVSSDYILECYLPYGTVAGGGVAIHSFDRKINIIDLEGS